MTEENGDVTGRFGFHTRFLQEAKVAKPVDKAVLPFPERHAVAVGEAGAHPAAVVQLVPGMAAIAVDMRLDVWNAGLEHGREVFIRPDSVNPVAGAGAGDECRRSVAWNCRVASTSEGRGAGIDQGHEVRPRRNPSQRIAAVAFVEILEEDRCWCGQFRAGGESHNADLIRIDVPLFRVCAHQTDGLEGVVDRIGLHVIAVAPQTITEDDSVHSVIVEPGNKVGAFRAYVERVVSASCCEDDSRARIEAAFNRVHFDGGIVDVDNAADPPRHRLAHVVLLGLAHTLLVEAR